MNAEYFKTVISTKRPDGARGEISSARHRQGVRSLVASRLLGMTFLVALVSILNFTFYIQPVRAQVCAPGSFSNTGNSCQELGGTGRVGTIDDCGNCTNLVCPDPANQRFCSGNCTPISSIPTGACTTAAGEDGTRDSCGTCRANAPLTVTRYSSYPATGESGFIHVSGDIGSGGDVYLNSGRAIHVDNAGSTQLNLGNFNGGATEFHFAIHSEGTGLAEMLLRQGGNTRWSLSVRPGDTTTDSGGDFEIRSGVTNWPRALAIDYNTGDVTIDTSATIRIVRSNAYYSATTGVDNIVIGDVTDTIQVRGGPLTVRGAAVLTQPSGCTGGQVLQWNGTAWVCATTGTSLSGGAANKIAFWTGTGTLSQNTNLHWDNAASRLGIGTTSPAATLQINAPASEEGLRIVSASNWSPLNIRNTVNTADIFRVDQTGTLAVGTVPWARITGAPTGSTPCSVNIVRSISSAATATQGNAGGYTGANTICGGTLHACTAEEVLHTINCGVSLVALNGQNGWVSAGPPGHTSLGNDCQGWTDPSSAALGRVWTFNATGGVGIDTPCNTLGGLPFVCCQ